MKIMYNITIMHMDCDKRYINIASLKRETRFTFSDKRETLFP